MKELLVLFNLFKAMFFMIENKFHPVLVLIWDSIIVFGGES